MSWNIICEFIVVGICQHVKPTLIQNLVSCVNSQRIPRRTNKNVTQPCSRVTPTYHRTTINKTLLESQRFQAKFCVPSNQERRTTYGIVDTTTIHHQSSKNLSYFCLPDLQIKLPQTELPPSTTVCRRLRHRRLLLLEFLQHKTILPHVSDDSRARV